MLKGEVVGEVSAIEGKAGMRRLGAVFIGQSQIMQERADIKQLRIHREAIDLP